MREKDKVLVAFMKMEKNQMFPLHLSVCNSRCFKAEIEDESTLWYLRYGHLNYKALKILKRKNMVTGFPNVDRPNKVCKTYIMGKEQQKSFPNRGSRRAGKRLDLVHSDVCGPISQTLVSTYPLGNECIDYMSWFITT